MPGSVVEVRINEVATKRNNTIVSKQSTALFSHISGITFIAKVP